MPGTTSEKDDGPQSDLDAATAAAVAAATVDGQGPSAEDVATARARAAALLEKDSAGMADLKNLTLSMGLPATRVAFHSLIKASGVRGALKAAAKKAVADFSPVMEVGCLKVDFYNHTTRSADVAYLLLDRCPRDHDFGAQLDRLMPHIDKARWPEVNQHFSMLLFLGRSTYQQYAAKHLGLIRKIFGLPADDPCKQYSSLQVDLANTTLFFDPAWPSRLGLYVRKDSDGDPVGPASSECEAT